MAGEYIEFNNNSQPALNDTNINRLQQLIKQDIHGAVSGDTLPVGAIMPFGSDTIPENWLLCNGQAVSRTDYQELFNTIGITYGTGDGFTTFNLPDLQGKIPVGLDENDTDFDTLGNTGGEKTHTLTINEMPRHKHNVVGNFAGTSGTNHLPQFVNKGIDWNDGDSDDNSQYTGGSQPHNILQPYIVQNYIIKAKQSAGVVATVVDGLNSTSATNALSANQGRILNDRFNYSTTEKVVGTWIDGKPIYRKVIDFGTLPNASSKTVSTGLNVNEVTICRPLMGYAYGIDTNNIHYILTLPDIAPNYPEGATRLTMSSSNSIYNIIITTGIDRSNYNCYVDVYYTKNTD